jgi:hypothetical protein
MGTANQGPAPGWYRFRDPRNDNLLRYWDGQSWQGSIHEVKPSSAWQRFGPAVLMFVGLPLMLVAVAGGMDELLGIGDSWAQDVGGVFALLAVACWVWAIWILRSRPGFPLPPETSSFDVPGTSRLWE